MTCEQYVLNLLKVEQEKNSSLAELITKMSQEKQSLQATIVNLELVIDELRKNE